MVVCPLHPGKARCDGDGPHENGAANPSTEVMPVTGLPPRFNATTFMTVELPTTAQMNGLPSLVSFKKPTWVAVPERVVVARLE